MGPPLVLEVERTANAAIAAGGPRCKTRSCWPTFQPPFLSREALIHTSKALEGAWA